MKESPSQQNKRIQLYEDFESMAESLSQDYQLYMMQKNRVLQPVTIVIPNKDTANWLKPYLANRIGILANIEFILPFEWIWKQYRKTKPGLPVVLPSERDPLTFSIFEWLREIEQNKFQGDHLDYLNVLEFLEDVHKERAMFSLASEMASVLDAYQNYRPELLLEWAEGQTHEDPLIAWQAELWRHLHLRWSKHHTYPADRATLFDMQLAAYSDMDKDMRSDIAGTFSDDYLFVFHAGLLSQPFLRLIDQNPFANVTLYSLIRSRKTIFAERFSHESEAILNSFRQLKEFSINETAPVDSDVGVSPPLSSPPAQQDDLPQKNRMLSWLKRAVQPVSAVVSADDSIEIHSCHNELREIEVLHQQIYSWLETIPDLRPSEIMVVTPDIKAFSPFIKAVFEQENEGLPKIPYRITDQQDVYSSELDAFIYFLNLLKSRFEPDKILEFLRYDSVMKRFELSERELTKIRLLIQENRVLWGFDSEHKRDLAQPPTEYFTWECFFTRAWNSLLWGKELSDPHSGNSVSLHDPEDIRLISLLQELLSTLNEARLFCEQSMKKMGDWVARMELWANYLFVSDPSDSGYKFPLLIQTLFHSLRSDVEQSGTQDMHLPFEFILKHLGLKTDRRGASSAKFGQGVLFTNMVPVRSIPARVVCMIGIGESRFPRTHTTPEYDVMSILPLTTDRNRKREDRQLFYEALMAAKEKFYISYVGQNQKDNSPIEPSTVVVEFFHVMSQIFPRVEIQDIQTLESMNGYSMRYFLSDPMGKGNKSGESEPIRKTATYIQRFAEMASQLRTNQSRHGIRFSDESAEPVPASVPSGLTERSGDTAHSRYSGRETQDPLILSPHDLITFFKHPIRDYLRHRFHLKTEQLLDEEWEFVINSLNRYKLRQYLLFQRINGVVPEEIFLSLQKAGQLPEGMAGRKIFDSLNRVIDVFFDKVMSDVEFVKPSPSAEISVQDVISSDMLEVEIRSSSWSLMGQLPILSVSGKLIHFSLSKSYGKSLIEFWIYHLLRSVQHPDSERIQFVLHQKNIFSLIRFRQLDPDKAESLLHDLILEVELGIQKPLRFFPNTAAEWFRKNQSQSPVFPDDLNEWSSFDFTNNRPIGEANDTFIQLLYGQNEELNPDLDYPVFERIMTPLMEALEEGS